MPEETAVQNYDTHSMYELLRPSLEELPGPCLWQAPLDVWFAYGKTTFRSAKRGPESPMEVLIVFEGDRCEYQRIDYFFLLDEGTRKCVRIFVRTTDVHRRLLRESVKNKLDLFWIIADQICAKDRLDFFAEMQDLAKALEASRERAQRSGYRTTSQHILGEFLVVNLKRASDTRLAGMIFQDAQQSKTIPC